MDMWKYFAVTHTDHTIMNPLSAGKMREIVDLLRLGNESPVLDIACGKAEYLCMVANRYDVRGTGVDASPFTAAEARENVKSRGMTGRIEILHMDGAKFEPEKPASYCLASCIGGSWVYGGHHGTLESLGQMTRPGGLVLVGEPFWMTRPEPEYLEKMGFALEQHGAHLDNIKAGENLGLTFLYSVVSNKDDWDRYEGLQWQAAERYAANHPDDPDVKALREKVRRDRDAYLRWGRECLGWALYLFQKHG